VERNERGFVGRKGEWKERGKKRKAIGKKHGNTKVASEL
jgi:hypothetical protein